MKKIAFAAVFFFLLLITDLSAQSISLKKEKLQPVNSLMSVEQVMGRTAVRVIKDSSVKTFDQPTFVKIAGTDFKNGTIEVRVLSRLLSNAPESARGFIGVAFRISESNNAFECIYIRPTNGRANDQLRRNHSIQYFSFPNYGFDRLRKEAPGVYESYADMALNQWTDLKIVVKDSTARFFINNNEQPALIVNDLKLGADATGSIGLWVDIGTEGFFSDLNVTH